jgi:tetratricopeptide (TPR) repeat protein
MKKLTTNLMWCMAIVAVMGFLAVSYLQAGFGNASAKENGKANGSSQLIAPPQSLDAKGVEQNSQKTANAVSAQSLQNGVIYAPRDVVDMTRLAMEITQSQSLHTNHVIEKATHVIVILFIVLGAIGGLWGVHKAQDIDDKFRILLEKHDSKLDSKLEAYELERQATIDLISGRVYIDQGLQYYEKGQVIDAKNWFNSGIETINRVLDKHPNISPATRIKSLSGLGYAYKRISEIQLAYEKLREALEIAKQHGYHKDEALLNFNLACYAILRSKHAEGLNYLKRSIEIDPTYKTHARDESVPGKDFDTVKNTPEFLAVIA